VLTAEFEADYYGDGSNEARFVVIGVPAGILDGAARLVATHGIRAYDAVQLASAIAARDVDSDCATFACFDRPLRRAAMAEGFDLLPLIAGDARGPALGGRGPANLACCRKS
jgi:hypothetical protein